jgi:hypothetical protein
MRVFLQKHQKIGFNIYIDGKLFFKQPFLESNSVLISDIAYTFFYISKNLVRLGLISPLNRLHGYIHKK